MCITCAFKNHVEHNIMCKEINHKGILDYFKEKLAKIHSFQDTIIDLIEQINDFMSFENPLSSQKFM